MNNKIGVYYIYFEGQDILDWEKCVKQIANAGAENVELSLLAISKLSLKERESIARIIKDYGLELTFATAIKQGNDISSPLEEERTRGINEFINQISIAEEMHGIKINGIIETSVKQIKKDGIITREEIKDYSAKSLHVLGNCAYNAGIKLGVEAVNRFECPIINTAEEAIEFVTQCDSKGIGVHLDTFHMNIEEDSISNAIISAKGKISHMHFAENHRGLPGTGSIHWENVIDAINEAGYQGSIVFESLTNPDSNAAERFRIYKNRISQSLESDLSRSIQYIKQIMKKH